MVHKNQDIGYDEPYYEGDTLQIVVTVEEDGSAKDLTGATASWAMSSDPGESPELTDADSGVSAVLSDAANGEITIEINDGTTEGLVGNWHHEVRLTDNSGQKSVVAVGRMAIEERVSA